MLIINATVCTMDGITIPNGYVAVSGDKIAKVGPMEECPPHWEGETFDAQGGHILPGFIDAHCHLGMFGDSLGFEGDDGNESTDHNMKYQNYLPASRKEVFQPHLPVRLPCYD